MEANHYKSKDLEGEWTEENNNWKGKKEENGTRGDVKETCNYFWNTSFAYRLI